MKLNKMELSKLFVPYPLALLAKENGFNEPCLAWYCDKKILPVGQKVTLISEKFNGLTNKLIFKPKTNVCAPLYSQIIDWFRVEHDIVINVDRDTDGTDGFEGVVDGNATQTFESYYEALTAALTEAFKLIKP